MSAKMFVNQMDVKHLQRCFGSLPLSFAEEQGKAITAIKKKWYTLASLIFPHEGILQVSVSETVKLSDYVIMSINSSSTQSI